MHSSPMPIKSDTLLEVGTYVRVGNQKGTVEEALLVRAHNGGQVALHKVKFTHSFKRGFGRNGKWVELVKPKTSSVNYSFIEVL